MMLCPIEDGGGIRLAEYAVMVGVEDRCLIFVQLDSELERRFL